MKNDKVVKKILLSIIMIFGVILVGIFSYFDIRDRMDAADYETTEAVLVDYRGSGDGGMCPLIYEYEVDGKSYRFVTDYEVNRNASPAVGTKMTVKYNPDSPGVFYSPRNRWVLFIMIGCMFVFISLAAVFIELRKRKLFIITLGVGMLLVIWLGIRLGLHQCGVLGIVFLAIPAIIAFASLMDLITKRGSY